MSALRPVCVGCQREMRCSQNGAFVRTSRDQIRSCDVYRCPICGVQVATGFAEMSVNEFMMRNKNVVADIVEKERE